MGNRGRRGGGDHKDTRHRILVVCMSEPVKVNTMESPAA